MKRMILPFCPSGETRAPSSKSHLHRLLILSALSKEETRIDCDQSLCEDVLATASALVGMGARIDKTKTGLLVAPIERIDGKKIVVDCRESGSTLRFLIPVCRALGINACFLRGERLRKRPVALYPMLDIACGEDGSVEVSGDISGKTYQMDGSVSSQAISGLLMALPLVGGGSISVVDPASLPYLTLTVSAMREFGVSVTQNGSNFTVPSATYRSPRYVRAQSDWSAAAFFLTAGVLRGDTTVSIEQNEQADYAVVAYLRKMGGCLSQVKDGFRAQESSLAGTELDCKHCPDLVPVLAVAASVAKGKTVIRGIGRLKHKESDRGADVANLIRALGGEAEISSDELIVEGVSRLSGGVADAKQDHRLVMAAAIAATVSSSPVIIEGAEAVEKSHPAFFEALRQIGATEEVV